MVINRLPLPRTLGTYRAHQRIADVAQGTPRWRRVDDYALVVSQAPLAGAEIKPYDPKILAGDRLGFVLRAEVSRSVFNRGERGQRVDPVLTARLEDPTRHYDAIATEVGKAWLDRKGEAHGFIVEALADANYDPELFVRPKDRKRIRLPVIDFRGVLRVIDAEAFRSALFDGIGRGRAWGLGLLLVYRIS